MIKTSFKTMIIIMVSLILLQCKDSKTGNKKETKQIKALIIQVKGKVLISNKLKAPLKDWKPVKSKQVIGKGTYLRTRPKSSCDLLLQNGSKIKIIEKSVIYIENMMAKDKDHKSKLRLYAGTVLSKPTKLSGNSEYTITTPTAVAGVRGTEFIVTFDQQKTSIAVNEGKVWVKRNISIDAKTQKTEHGKHLKNTALKEVNLNAGEASDIHVNDHNKIKKAIEKAKKGEKVNIEHIKQTTVIKPRQTNNDEKKKFVIFEDIRKMPAVEKEHHGVLLILAGAGTKIFINEKYEGSEMLMRIAKTGIYDIKITRNGKTIKQVKAEVKSKQKTEIKLSDPVFFEPESPEEKRILNKARQEIFKNDKPNTNVDLDSRKKPFQNDKPKQNFNFENKNIKKQAQSALEKRSRNLKDTDTVEEQRRAVRKPENSTYGSGQNTMRALEKRGKRIKKKRGSIFR